MRGVDLRGTIFDRANLAEVLFTDADLSTASFRGAILDYADLSGATLHLADFSHARMHCVLLENVRQGMHANFDGAQMHGSVMIDSDFSHSTFRGTSLKWISMEHTRFERAKFDSSTIFLGAYMIHCRFPNVMAEGANFDGAYIDHGSFTFSDLDRATFRKGVYLELSLEGSSARFVQFDGSDLSRADFTGTALQQTSFVETKLSHAAFNWANVNGADFKDAYDMGTVSGFIARDAFNVPEMFEPRLTKPKIGRAQFQSPYYFGVSIC